MLTAIALIAALPQTAADPREADRRSTPLVSAVADCRTIGDPAARLACFDQSIAALLQARDAKQIVVLDQADVREARRSVFGFSLPNIRLFGSKEKDAGSQVSQIESTIARKQTVAGNYLRVALADKTIWQTTESAMTLSPRIGDPISIEAGMLGSYIAKIGRRSIRVKRVQ